MSTLFPVKSTANEFVIHPSPRFLFFAFIALMLFANHGFAQTTYFSQDFNSSTTLSSYFSASPSSGQFNSISSIGGATASVATNALVFSRTAGTNIFVRSADFSPLPTSFRYSFDLSTTSSGSTPGVAELQVGQGFSTITGNEPVGNVYDRIGIDYSSTSGTWRLRDITSGSVSGLFSGIKTVTWVMNNSGAVINYIAPNNSQESVGNDKMDVWIDNTKVFDDKTVTNPGDLMTDLKFRMATGSGTITLDNISITDLQPAITCASNPAPVNADPNSCYAFVNLGPPSVSAVCSPATSISNSVTNTSDASEVYTSGLTDVIWTVTDNCGHSLSCTNTVTVIDNQPPVFAGCTNKTGSVDPNSCSHVTIDQEFDPASVMDNCDLATNDFLVTGETDAFGEGTLSGVEFQKGVSHVSWTATDIHGNISNCNYDVTIAGPTATISGTNTICNGSSTNLSIAFTGTSPWTYQVNGGSPITTSDNPVLVPVTPPITTSYSVTALTDGSGCTAESTDLIGTVIITVNTRPSATVTSADATICNGGSTNISGSITATGAWTLTLNNGGGSVSGTGSGTWLKSVSPASATTYTIASLSDELCASDIGDITGDETVTVNNRPTASITSGDATICNGLSTIISGTITANGAWTLTLSTTETVTGSGSGLWTKTVSPSSNSSYSISSLNDELCTSEPGDLSGVENVIVNARPTGEISGGAVYCSNDNTNTTLNITATGTGTISGTLSDGTPFNGSAGIITVNVTPVSTTTYTIATLEDDDCTAQAGDLTGTATITINPSPNAPVITTNSPIHSGNNLILNSDGGFSAYSWSGPNSFVSSNQNNTINSATAAATGTYTLVVTNAFSCSETTSVSVIVFDNSLYVNDVFAAGDHYTSASGNDANPGTASAPFATIAHAVSVAANNDLIYVDAGLYVENVIINKSVMLLGSNAGNDARNTRPESESIVRTNGNQDIIFSVTSSNVMIDGFTIDGDDPNVTGATVASGADVNVNYCIRPTAGSNLTLANNILKHAAIGMRANYVSSGNVISKNWFDEIGNFDFGYAISIRDNYYADITNNKMTKVWTGAHINNHNGGGGPASFTMSGNEVHSYAAGLCYWLNFNAASPFIADNNQFYAEAGAVSNNFGILVVTLQDAVNATFTNNTITGTDYGIGLFNVPTSNHLTLGPTNSISGTAKAAILLTNNLNFNPVGTTDFLGGGAGASSTVNISGIAISSAPVGTGIELDATHATPTTQTLNFASLTTVNGGTIGLVVNGATTAIAGNSINNLSFSGQSGDYITLTNGALDNLQVDATGSAFDGLTGGASLLSQNFATEDKITHAQDNSSIGFILVKAGEDFVTANSGSIQRGIDNASNGFIENVATGTYTGNLLINKSLDIRGPNYSINPNTGVRVNEATLLPATDDAENGVLVDLESSNVSLKGFLLNGDNPGFNSGNSVDGIDVNTSEGIQNAPIWSGPFAQIDNLDIQNNIFDNFDYQAIYLETNLSSNHSFNYIRNNQFNNMWEGVQTYAIHTDISDNVFTGVDRAVSVHGTDANCSTGFTPKISGNEITINWKNPHATTRNVAVWVNYRRGTAPALSVDHNTIHYPTPAPAGKTFIGFYGLTITDNRTVTFADNVIDGENNCHRGLYLSNVPSSNVSLTGSSFTDINDYGVYAVNNDLVWGSGDARILIDNSNITMSAGATAAIAADGSNAFTPNVTAATITNSTLTGGASGILVSGSLASADIHNNSSTITGADIGVDIDGGSASLYRNSITSNDLGVRVKNNGALGSATENFITGNTNGGISIEASAGATGVINNNDLTGNGGYFINNASANNIDASCNWWGTTDAAVIFTKKNGNITFIPFLSNGTDNDGGTDGFQPVPASCVSPADLYVNDNSTTGDSYTTATGNDANPGTVNAPFATVQHAVNAAASTGNAIWVDAGSYTEQIKINKSVDIKGAGSSGIHSTNILAPASMNTVTNVNGSYSPIIYVSGIDSVANIDQVNISGNGGRSVSNFMGLCYFSASGTFSNSRISQIRDVTFSGIQRGIAFFANHQFDVSVSQQLNVSNDTIDDYQKAGIVINELNTEGNITNNIITGQNSPNINGENGIQFGYGSWGTITGNAVTGNIYNGPTSDVATGILLAGVGVNNSGNPTGKTLIIGGAGLLSNSLSGNEAGMFTANGGFGYSSNQGVTFAANNFTNNSIHVAELAPSTTPNPSNTYDKRVDNASITNTVYGKIQRAVKEASPTNVLTASANTFDEQVVIDKDLTLQGAGASSIIQPSSPSVISTFYTYPAGVYSPWVGTVMASTVLVINNSTVTLKDFAVDGANVTSVPAGSVRLAGILYGEASGTIDNVTINSIKTTGYADRSYGIDASATTGSHNIEIKNCNISDWSRNAIQVMGSSLMATVHNNTLIGPGLIGPANVPNGILFIHGVNGNATANTIHDLHYSTSASRSAGILFFDPLTAGIVAEENQVYNSDDGMIVAATANDVMVRKNYLHNNEVGVQVENGALNNTITNNTIVNNTITAIRLDGALNPNGASTPPGTGNAAHNNNISNNPFGIVSYDNTKTFDATCNWFGSSDPATVNSKTSGIIEYTPYLDNGGDNSADPAFFDPVAICSGNCTLAITSIDVTDATCENGTNGFATANISGEVGTTSYLWSNGDATQTASALDDGSTYTVTVTDESGCSATNSTVTIGHQNNNSADPTSAIATPSLICNGDNSTLTIGGGGLGTNETIHWFTSACGVGSIGTGNNLIVSPITTTTYYGRYDDGSPCTFSTNCLPVTVIVNQKSTDPSAATASSDTICNGQSTMLILSGGGNGDNESIHWYANACGTGAAGTGNNLVVSPAVTTTYYGRYENGAPCNYNSACEAVTITVIQHYHDWYVNDNSSANDIYTFDLGNDANPGTRCQPFATIQHAVNTAAAGDTIYTDAGSYAATVNVNKSLVITGAGNTVATGSIISGSGTLVTLAVPGTSSSNRMVLDNFRISGGATGISGNSHVTISRVVSTGNSSYGLILNTLDDLVIDQSSFIFNNFSGIKIPSNESVTHITVTDSHFDNNPYGWYADANATTKPDLDHVTVTNSTFSNNSDKGLYTERLSNALFEDVTVQNSGATNGPPAGMDINLKWKAYTNIEFRNVTVSGSGTGSTSGVGITIKARNDVPPYSVTPASASGIIINNCHLTSPGIFGITNLYALTFGNNIADVTFTGNNVIDGTGGGVSIYTDNATPVLDLGTTSFDGSLANYIGMGSARKVTATSATFNTLTGAVMNPAQLFAAEDKIIHKIDYNSFGFVLVKTNNDYVTANSFISPLSTAPSIQRGIDAASNGFNVNVDAGSFNEDVTVNKPVNVLGSGPGSTYVSGPIGGSSTTFFVTSANVLIDGFTITRDGNNTTDWNNAGLNSAGVAIQGQGINAEIRYCEITGMRTGIDINNSNGNNIHNNNIHFNRTGMIFRNQTDNTSVIQNIISDNWTLGILFLDGSGGTNSPVQSALNSSFNDNNISANWYGQIEDRQSGGSLPAPGTNPKNFTCNWYGVVPPTVSTANSTEPSYALQIPVAYGGSAVPPGGQPDISGPASANFIYLPLQPSGTDVGGNSNDGFQPSTPCSGSCLLAITGIDIIDAICQDGTDGTATVNTSGAFGNVTYLWSNGQTSQTATGLTDGVTYSVTVTDDNGCFATTNDVVIGHQNTRSGNPIDATASSINICNGETVTLTLNGGGGGSNENISWYTTSCGGELAGTGNNLSVTPAVTTTYFGRYEDGSPCTFNTSCAFVTITVNQKSADPTDITATFTTLCDGESTTLTLNGGGNGTNETIHWYSGSCSGVSEGTGNGLVVTPASTTVYYARYEDGAPCNYNSACASITIVVNSLSVAPATVTASLNNFCTGGSTDLSVTDGSLGTGATWKWYTASCGGTPAGTGSTLTVSPATTTTYFVRAEGDCNTTDCAFITITVKSLSTAASSASASPSFICYGSSTNLSVTGGSLGTGASWKWYSGTCNGTPVGTGSPLNVSPTVTTTYFARAEGDCNTTSCVSVTVTVNPQILFTTSQTNVKCKGGSTGTASVSVSGGSSPYTYLWSNNRTVASIINLSAGTYTVTITDHAGCSVQASVIITQPLNPLTVSITGTYAGHSLTANPAGGTAGYTYLWNTGATSQCVGACNSVPLVHQTYIVTVTDINGCKASASKAVKFDEDGLDPFDAEVYPNPTINTVTLEFTATGNDPYRAELRDIQGKLLLTDEGMAAEGRNLLSFDLGDFAAGTYFLFISEADQSKVLKIILQR